jgi:hypothetical protein
MRGQKIVPRNDDLHEGLFFFSANRKFISSEQEIKMGCKEKFNVKFCNFGKKVVNLPAKMLYNN